MVGIVDDRLMHEAGGDACRLMRQRESLTLQDQVRAGLEAMIAVRAEARGSGDMKLFRASEKAFLAIGAVVELLPKGK